jgi:hypothetical protein
MHLDNLFLQKQQQRGLACDPVWKEENLSKKKVKRRYEIME